MIKQKHLRLNLIRWFSFFAFAVCILLGGNVFAQTGRTITGTVIDGENNEMLIGATVVQKGTTNGVQTDIDGNFSLPLVSNNDTIIISYIGYTTQEIPTNGQSNVSIILQQGGIKLTEAVVIGYGTARKSDLTGSVVSIDGAALKQQPIADVAETLTGRLAGVQVSSSEGSPDAEVNIRVRGSGSITQGSQPLIIVDGFPIDNLSDISPSDIQNISVLKDASSTAIYGSRGANGVIIITTKNGRSGKISVDYNVFYGVRKNANIIDALEPEDYVKWQYEYALLDADIPGDAESYERFFGLYQDFDQYQGLDGNNWQELIFGRQGDVLNNDLAIRGGTDKLNFNFNFASYNLKAIQIGSDYVRNNLSLALKSKASEKVDLSFRIRYSDAEINGGGANEQNAFSSSDSRLQHVVGYSPIPIPGVTSSFDDTDQSDNGRLLNPYTAIDDNQRIQNRRNLNLTGSFAWEIIENLRFKTDLGFNFRNDLNSRFYGKTTGYTRDRVSAEFQGLPALILEDRKRERMRVANTLNYDFKKILPAPTHNLNLLVGQEYILSKDNNIENELQGFPSDFTFSEVRKLTTQSTPLSVDHFFSPDDKLLSFFARANYDFQNRFLLTATFRADGSSKFLGDNRWGYFPSAAFAWKLSEENFLSNAKWLDFLKLRISYGQAGNNNIPAGQTFQTFRSATTTYINDVSSIWITENTLANPDLKWETTITQNIGLDFNVLNNKVGGTLEFYKNNTKDLLVRFPLPGTGFNDQFRNIGEVVNSGMEVSLSYYAISKPDYGLDFSFNLGINRNEVLSLGELEDIRAATGWASTEIGADYIVEVGQPIGMMYGYLNDGRYEVSDFSYDEASGEYTLNDGVVDSSPATGQVQPGSLKLIDISGPDGVPDGIVDVNDNTIIGNANPDFQGGLVINAYAYGFDLSAGFNFSSGFDVYNADKVQFTTSRQQYTNLSTLMADGERWTNLDPTTGQLVTEPGKLAELNANTTLWSPFLGRRVFSDWAVEDGSFFRLNTLSIGYTLPESLLKDKGISRLRFYTTATNVFVLTNYSGSDPEVSTRRRTPLTPNVDNSAYPRSRQIVFGLNLSF